MGGCPLPGLFCWGVAVWVAMDLLTMVANHSQQSHPGSMIPDYLGVLVTGLTKKYPKNNCYYNYNGMKMFKHLNHRSTFIQACHYQLCPTFIPGAGNDTATLVGIVQGYSYLVEVQDSGLRTFLLRGPAQSEVPSGFGSSCHPNFPENKKKSPLGQKSHFHHEHPESAPQAFLVSAGCRRLLMQMSPSWTEDILDITRQDWIRLQ